MNTDAIFAKYWNGLATVEAVMLPRDTAIALALRLAIQETADANAALINDMSAIIANLRSQELIPESALVAAQNEAAMLRQQRGALIEEVAQLRQSLAQLDADNANLIQKLAAFNRIAAIEEAPAIHTNGNGTAPAPFDWRLTYATELSDYWESLDAGRRTFRQLDKRIRLDLVQTALTFFFKQMPTQAAFNAAKPEWMPTATTLCTAFECKWEDLPSLKWEQVKL